MVAPLARQGMIASSFRNSLVFSQQGDDDGNESINVVPMLSSFLALEVTTERARILNRPQSSHSSGREPY
jgi:hypothetical protein